MTQAVMNEWMIDWIARMASRIVLLVLIMGYVVSNFSFVRSISIFVCWLAFLYYSVCSSYWYQVPISDIRLYIPTSKNFSLNTMSRCNGCSDPTTSTASTIQARKPFFTFYHVLSINLHCKTIFFLNKIKRSLLISIDIGCVLQHTNMSF